MIDSIENLKTKGFKHLPRAIYWFDSIKELSAKQKWAIHVREWNMWIELFEAAEEGEI